VFATEPLPSDSKLWGLLNVLLTPHCSARTSRFMFDNVQLFLDNLARYVAGEELLNVVDKTLGF
jgi:phosphoglycerate dehydrogenase-like enzyme